MNSIKLSYPLFTRFAIKSISLLTILAMLVFPITSTKAHEPGFEEKAWSAIQPVTVDGAQGATEWEDAPKIVSHPAGQDSALNLKIKQNGTNLYIALDKESLGNNNSRIFYIFDTNHDGLMDSGDRAVQLLLSGGGIGTTTYYQSNDGSNWASIADQGWTFARSSNSFEASIPLASIGLGADGNLIGFAVLTCDGTTNNEVAGWPEYTYVQATCPDLSTYTDGASYSFTRMPADWGNITRTSEQYKGTSASTTSWSNFTFQNYTYRNDLISDWETSQDPSHGPAAVQPDDIDIASDTLSADPGGKPSVQYAFYDNGTTGTAACDANRLDDIVAFRTWTDGDPHFKTGYASRNWNILLDFDSDGYKEIVLNLAGWWSQNGADVLNVYYENLNSQEIQDPATALRYIFLADSVDADNSPDTLNGSAASFVSYRRVQRGNEGLIYDYELNYQIPIRYLDRADDGLENCSISSATPVAMFYSTSASNINPLQKDWMMDPMGQSDGWTPDQPIEFGDPITWDPRGTGGDFKLTPLGYNETVGPGTVVNFAHTLTDLATGGGSKTYYFSVTTSGTCGTVTLYFDNDGDGYHDPTETTVVPSPLTIPKGSSYNFVAVVTAGSGHDCDIQINVADAPSGGNVKSALDQYNVLNSASPVKVNELMYDPSTGNEWLELTNTNQWFDADLDNWVITDNDSNTYTIPAMLAPMPPVTACPNGDEARVIIVFGSGSNETDWTDCLVTLYTGTSNWFENDADEVSLCTGACSSATIVDFVAYGASPETDDTIAVAAGIWPDNLYALDVPTGNSLSRFREPDLRDGYDTNSWSDWYAANAPSPGEENTPNIVINEVEFDGAVVDWAELFVKEDGVAGSYGLDIRNFMLTDLDGTDTALATSSVSVFSGDYVRVWWGAGTDETDSQCATTDCGAYRDLYVGDTAPNASTDDQLALMTAATGGQYLDAVLWDGTSGANIDTWCAACGDGGTNEGTDATTLASYTLNGMGVRMWSSASGVASVSGEAKTAGTTIGRDGLSNDTNAAVDWDDTGGKDAVDETPGRQNIGAIINEVMINPMSGNEWVEIYCGGNLSAASYTLAYGSGSYAFSLTCTAGSYVKVDLPSGDNLGDGSGYVRLCQGASCSSSTIKDFVAYGADAGTGDDMAVAAGIWINSDFVGIGGLSQGETIGRDKDQTDTNLSGDWDTHGGADAIGPTPTARNIGNRLVFNEVMYDPTTGYEWIEIYNPTGSSQNIDGFVIQDGDGNSYTLPAALDPIPAGEYLVIYLDDGGLSGSDDYTWLDGDPAVLHANFVSGNNNDGNALGTTDVLSLCSSACNSSTVQDFIAWGASQPTKDDEAVTAGIWVDGAYILTTAVSTGESIGRDKDSTDLNQPSDWADHGGQDAVGTTQGKRNVGSVVFNEISYMNSTLDWVELYNPSTDPLNLDTFCLSLDDGATCYNFPDSLQLIPAGGYLVIHFGTGANDYSWADGDIAVLYTCGGDGCSGGELSGLSDTSAALSLYSNDAAPNSTSIVDFFAYGADPGANDTDAVTAGLWDDGDYFYGFVIDADETIGRDKNSTDTNQLADWSDSGGPDAQTDTYGLQNLTNPYTPNQPEGPTAVYLAGFNATRQPGQVLVTWQTTLEINVIGFNIYRSTSPYGQRELLTPDMVLSQGMGGLGGSYQFIDLTAQEGVTYYYWLEVVDLEGNSIEGPLEVLALKYFYLPLLRR